MNKTMLWEEHLREMTLMWRDKQSHPSTFSQDQIWALNDLFDLPICAILFTIWIAGSPTIIYASPLLIKFLCLFSLSGVKWKDLNWEDTILVFLHLLVQSSCFFLRYRNWIGSKNKQGSMFALIPNWCRTINEYIKEDRTLGILLPARTPFSWGHEASHWKV